MGADGGKLSGKLQLAFGLSATSLGSPPQEHDTEN